jgi:N-acetyl-anhydromuramyl-L-alanine amidase AmpD
MPCLYSHADALRYLGKRYVRNYGERGDYKIDWIILHYTWGHKRGDLDTLTSNRASSHLYITNEGDIWWLVPFQKAAWHAGITWKVPGTWQWKRWKALRPNERSIGIEIEGFGEFTPDQYRALEWCLPLLLRRYDIPLAFLPDPLRGMDPRVSKKHGGDAYEIEELLAFRGILGHGNTHYGKVDPGLNFEWDRIRCIPPMPETGPQNVAERDLYVGDMALIPEGGIGYELETV